ncbi:MAG: ATP/GTP-binding protein [Candidatus Hadarchaeales archaeon]
MTNLIYLLGPAGSGKSTLTQTLLDTLEGMDLDCIAINLDPGAEWLPYTPEIDIRKDISLTEIMRTYRLGPNGGLIAAIDMLAEHLPRLRELIKGRHADYVLVDTPGQMELFAFRETGPAIIRELAERRLTLFLADSFLSRQACSFVSLLMLSASVFVRFRTPQIIALSKVDLLEPHELDRMLEWWENREKLVDALQEEPNPLQREVASSLLQALQGTGLPGELLPVSSTSGYGITELVSAIERTFGTEGELDLGREEQVT